MNAVYDGRRRRVAEYMRQEGLDQIIVTATPSVFWLTGLWIEPHERMLALLLDDTGEMTLFGNRLFAIDAEALPFAFALHGDGDDPLRQLAAQTRPGAVGIDKTWPAKFLLGLMALRPDLHPRLGSAPVDIARMHKDSYEIDLMRAASRLNDEVVAAAVAALSPGVTETELAAFIAQTYLALGADFPVGVQVVCFGPNAADPHHLPDQTVLREGDGVLFDLFTPVSRYWCDMTRTVYCKTARPDEAFLYETVKKANLAAIDLARPGTPLRQIDAAARDVIAQAGFGDYFIHRLGHGAGLECHEPPDCSAVSTVTAAPGMVFSIEPGIYIPGRCGVRIEDLVLVTETGCEPLNVYSKALQIVG
jgi:Xaa-Pro dipeptidase